MGALYRDAALEARPIVAPIPWLARSLINGPNALCAGHVTSIIWRDTLPHSPRVLHAHQFAGAVD